MGDVCGGHGRALATPLAALHTQPPAHPHLPLGSVTRLPAPPAALVQAHDRALAHATSARAPSPPARSSFQTVRGHYLPACLATGSPSARPDLPSCLSSSDSMLDTTCFFVCFLSAASPAPVTVLGPQQAPSECDGNERAAHGDPWPAPLLSLRGWLRPLLLPGSPMCPR